MHGGKFAFQNWLGQLLAWRKFTIFAASFYFVFEGKFQVQAPRGASEGRLNGGFFLRCDFGGLIFGFYGIRKPSAVFTDIICFCFTYPIYTGPDKFLNGRNFYPCNPFTRNLANNVIHWSTRCRSKTCKVLRVPCERRPEPCKFFSVQKFVLPRVNWVTDNNFCTNKLYRWSKITCFKSSQLYSFVTCPQLFSYLEEVPHASIPN